MIDTIEFITLLLTLEEFMTDKLIISERDNSNGICRLFKYIVGIDWYGSENNGDCRYTVRITLNKKVFGEKNEVTEYFNDKELCLKRWLYLIEKLRDYLADE